MGRPAELNPKREQSRLTTVTNLAESVAKQSASAAELAEGRVAAIVGPEPVQSDAACEPTPDDFAGHMIQLLNNIEFNTGRIRSQLNRL